MADHDLIAAHLAELARRLPAENVEELADGLDQTYRHHLASTGDPHTAARAALAEFGSPDQITTAFTLHSPARRAARILLATGPPVAAAWAIALLTSHAWHWPVPTPARLAIGLLLLTVIATLAAAATARGHHARTRTAALGGGIGLLILDAAGLSALTLAAPAPAWPLALAAAASLTRTGLTLRTLPRIIAN